MPDEIIYNHFIRVLDQWIAIHDEAHYFPTNPSWPQISYRWGAQYIHANEAFTRLPHITQEALVAHELGHHHHQHGATGDGQLRYILRHMSVASGVVEPHELEADLYACDMVGTRTYVGVLRDRIIDAKSRGFTAAAQELELRAAVLEQ